MKTALLWIACVFFFLAGVIYMPSLASILFLALGVFTLPMKKFRHAIGQKIPKGIQITLVVILFLVAVFITPSEMLDDGTSTDTSNSTVESTISSTTASASVGSSTSATETTATTNRTETTNKTESTTAQTETTTTQTTTATTTTPPTITPGEDSVLEVHFIDVGQADAALVVCDGYAMMIDGGNKADSDLIYTYLKKHNITHLEYIVATHAHEDHIGGLPGALTYATVNTVYCPTTIYDTDAFEDFVRYVNNRGATITVPKAGDSFYLGAAKVEIFACNTDSGDINNTSIVLKITHGEVSFLFTGDAEREVEQAILDAGYDLKSTVLKVAHHGSESSTTYPFLREVLPSVAVISVGANNSYGHPTDEALSKLRDAGTRVFRTDMQGDIICTSDGEFLTIEVDRNVDADTLKPGGTSSETKPSETTKPTETMVWIPKSGTKYHSRSSCSNMKNPSQVTKSEAESMGYGPCSKCH